MFPVDLMREARNVLEVLRSKGWMVATAESCTGGLIAGLLTEIPGSSDVVDRGFVTYSNDAKSKMIGVPEALIVAHGAVSRDVAIAMAEGALAASRAQITVAVTGVAGPGGGTHEKPVGLVHIASARHEQPTVHRECRFGDRSRTDIRLATIKVALALITEAAAASR